MGSDWSVVKTGDIFELINGYAFKGRDFTADGTAVLKIKNIKAGKLNLDNLAFVDTSFLSEKPDKIVLRDDLLITMSGNRHDGSMETWVGKVCWFGLTTNYLINQRVGILRLKKNINANPRFLAYQLSSTEFQHHFIAVATSSGGQANLSPAQIKSTELFLPPRQTQDRVAKILGELEDKIKVNKQLNQTLEQIAQAIFKSWFVDFEPVKAKINALAAGGSEEDALLAAMQAISGKDKAQLTQLQTDNPEHYNQLRTTAELFPSAMQDSELGDIPEGWQNGALADIARFSKDKIATSELTVATYISTENMLENKKGITEASTVSSASSVPKFNPKQVLISNIRPYFKKIWFANKTGGRSPDVLGFESKTSDSEEFLYNTLFQDCFFEYMMLTSKGAKMPRGDKKAIMQFPVVIPCSNIMRAFCQRVKPFYIFIAENNQECLNLESLRDTLLPHLLSGQLSVHN